MFAISLFAIAKEMDLLPCKYSANTSVHKSIFKIPGCIFDLKVNTYS